MEKTMHFPSPDPSSGHAISFKEHDQNASHGDRITCNHLVFTAWIAPVRQVVAVHLSCSRPLHKFMKTAPKLILSMVWREPRGKRQMVSRNERER